MRTGWEGLRIEDRNEGEHIKKDSPKNLPTARTHLSAEAVANRRPSVENDTLRMYEEWLWLRVCEGVDILSCLTGVVLPGVEAAPPLLFVGMKATMVCPVIQ